ncbi:MAG: hypothetical protein LBU89_13435 [Fibromonadaceae bacterium]|jgi:hypothetical protein|nr:hypothetical protein [Fibromonadaceae bacterium]
MDRISGYSVASNYSSYNAGKTSQTSNKSFTIPTEAPMIGPLTFQRKDSSYNPFKDIAETGNVNFPEWMQTKTTPARSDEEILKDIEELAKEHARIGVSKSKLEDDERFLKLMYEYISSVSPDREGILKSSVMEINERLENEFPGAVNSQYYSMSDIYRQVDSQRTKEDEDKKEPIDYLIEMLKNKEKAKGSSGGTISSITKNGDYYTIDVDYGGGKKSTLNYTNSGEFVSMQMQGNNYFVGGIDSSSGTVTAAQFFDDSGYRIMDYNPNGGLYQKYTEEESKRMQDVFGTYNAVYYVATGDNKGYEAFNKEAYNSTYERLMSEKANSVA